MKSTLAIRRLVLPLLALIAVGCDTLLNVELPASVPATALDDPARATLLVQSAISDFECAYGNYIVATGLLVDELLSGSLTNSVNWDRRLIGPNDMSYSAACGQQGVAPFNLAVYTPLSTARFTADDALHRIDRFPDAAVPNKKELLATAAAYAGYAYTLFGEAFCRAAFDLGAALQPTEVWTRAEQRFTRTIELADSVTPAIVTFARVGRARVRLNLGKTAEALADARLVPDTFVRNATYGSAPARRQNTVWVVNNSQPSVSIDTSFRNLKVAGAPDPRVPVVDAGRRAIDVQVPLWQQKKYPLDSSPIPIASGKEAQLIIAEIEGGQSAVNAINGLRKKAGLPLFSSSNVLEIAKQVLEERRRELFLEGHRLGDILRLALPFPSGRTHRNETYGTTTCIELPQSEIDNNPSLRK